MRENKINSLIWFLIAVFLLGILIRGLSGEDWRDLRFWAWGSKHEKVSGKTEKKSRKNLSWEDKLENALENAFDGDTKYSDEDSLSEADYVKFTFNAEDISKLDINTVSERLLVTSSPDQEDIKVLIQNNFDVTKFFNVAKKGDTLVVERKKTTKINIHGFNNSEVIVKLPDTLFDSATFNSVSGKLSVENVKARKIDTGNVSGKTEITNGEGKIHAENVSGKIEIDLDEVKNNIKAETVSGKIEITVPGKTDFIADYETVSGSVKTDFEKHGKKDGTISNGNRTYDFQLETVSGSIEVNRR